MNQTDDLPNNEAGKDELSLEEKQVLDLMASILVKKIFDESSNNSVIEPISETS